MHIVGVTIENFQSIKMEKTKVVLKDGINVLVGSSNSGKSAFLRAIKWNLTNTPSGGEFIKKGANEARVLIEWSDGHAVERFRNLTGSKNTYVLFKDGEVVEEYTGFGSSVPPLILETTGISLDIPFNFANQLEAPFLLSESPKNRAETIGNLEELGRIDQTLSGMNDDIRLTKKEYTAKQKELLSLEKAQKEMERTIEADRKKTEMVTFLRDAIEEKESIYAGLTRLHTRLASIEQEVDMTKANYEKSKRIVSAWDDELPEQVEVYRRLMTYSKRLVQVAKELSEVSFIEQELLDRLSTLSNFVTDMTSTYQRLVGYANRLLEIEHEKQSASKNIKPRTAAIDIAPVDLDVERYRTLFMQSKRLVELELETTGANKKVEALQKEIEQLLNEFVDALQDEKICPTCTQSTESITLETVEQRI